MHAWGGVSFARPKAGLAKKMFKGFSSSLVIPSRLPVALSVVNPFPASLWCDTHRFHVSSPASFLNLLPIPLGNASGCTPRCPAPTCPAPHLANSLMDTLSFNS
eukprot:EG_transcript_45397